MDSIRSTLEQFLFDAFHKILQSEERMLAQTKSDLSLHECHLISKVCQMVDSGQDNRTSAIAEQQHVTIGTLSTSVSQLERKGYLERRRDTADRRIVRIIPTELGRAAHELHLRFREDLTDQIMSALPAEEAAAFVQSLSRVSALISRKCPQCSV